MVGRHVPGPGSSLTTDDAKGRMVRVRGAREHNLKNVDLDIPREALVVFTGVSGSGKSSLAFGTLYAEAQRRYFDSVSPYARRLIDQVGVADVDSIEGLPPAVALQQQRGAASARSSIGSLTTISNLLRMLFSRAGTYPKRQPMLYAEDFSPNTPQGACPTCQGLGSIHDVTEAAMVPDDSLTIREGAIAAWPPAWHGQNLRDILVSLGHDIDTPWRDLPRKTRDWILYTEEQPRVPVYAGFTPAETRAALRRKAEPSYQGTFTGARKYVLRTFATTQSELMKKRVSRFLGGIECPTCKGKRLKPEALSVKFAGRDIAELGRMSLAALATALGPVAQGRWEAPGRGEREGVHEEKRIAAQRIARSVLDRVITLASLGLSYLALDRSTPTLSPGELQRVRLATQIQSNLFGVVYVLDEPSAGLHPADREALLIALDRLKRAGNSLFVVEHDVAVIRHADWIVDVGPGAGASGGEVLYSGPLPGLKSVLRSKTAEHLFRAPVPPPPSRSPSGWLRLRNVHRNNLHGVDADFPLGVLTAVTGVSGSGKSSLVSQALVELVSNHLGVIPARDEDDAPEDLAVHAPSRGEIVAGADRVRRLVRVDQKPIGRTPRSNLATYTGLFDAVRKLYAETPAARRRHYSAGRFSFNVAGGRCETCEGEGFVCIELLFMPSVYAPCSSCRGARFNDATLEVKYRERSIADVLGMSVEEACNFFADAPLILRPLKTLDDIGLGYLRLGQPATELSGGEAQRVKLATELQRIQRVDTLYVLDEPTTGLHPADVARLLAQLRALVDAGNTVIVVEHDLDLVNGSDWVIDMGPGAGEDGGRIVATATPAELASCKASRIAPYLAALAAGVAV
jgi:excinuclease ABC subunit A